MKNDAPIDSARLIDDRYTPPDCGELDGLTQVLSDGRLSGGAPVIQAYEQAIAAWFSVSRAIAVNSGSSALHATLVALDVRSGTEVMVPATAPLPTAMPILTCGATPVIVDTLPDSLALDPSDVERKLTARTRAAIVLPLWGYPNDETQTMRLLAQAHVQVIEDACQAHGTQVRGQYAGTLAMAGCFSTHDRKLLATGEGGFVLTNNAELAERIDFYTHLGHLKGKVHGVNYKLAAPLAAIGIKRLNHLNPQLQTRRINARSILDALPPSGCLQEFAYGENSRPNYYNLVLSAKEHQHEITQALAASGLPSDSIRYRYRALGQQPMFVEYATHCPNAEAIVRSTFQIPVHPAMPPSTVQWVAERVSAISRTRGKL